MPRYFCLQLKFGLGISLFLFVYSISSMMNNAYCCLALRTCSLLGTTLNYEQDIYTIDINSVTGGFGYLLLQLANANKIILNKNLNLKM